MNFKRGRDVCDSLKHQLCCGRKFSFFFAFLAKRTLCFTNNIYIKKKRCWVLLQWILLLLPCHGHWKVNLLTIYFKNVRHAVRMLVDFHNRFLFLSIGRHKIFSCFSQIAERITHLRWGEVSGHGVAQRLSEQSVPQDGSQVTRHGLLLFQGAVVLQG